MFSQIERYKLSDFIEKALNCETLLISIQRLCDLFKQPRMTSEITEVNYLEFAEELCAYDDVHTTKKGFLSLVITPFDKAY